MEERDDGIEKQKDAVLSILEAVTKTKPSSTATRSRQLYEERLLTFQVSTYYAKPECLSPIICARFGWSNADEDLLECTTCRAVVAIMIPSGLSGNAIKSISRSYRKQLAIAHTLTCPFRIDAEQFLLRNGSNITTTKITEGPTEPVPTYMAAILPPEDLELIEHPSPSVLVRGRLRRLEEVCRSLHKKVSPNLDEMQGVKSCTFLPKLEIDPLLRNCRLDGDEENVDAIVRVSNFLGSRDQNASSIMLTILGWVPIEPTKISTSAKTRSLTPSRPTLQMGCPICFALMDLPLVVEEGKKDDSNTSAKQPAIIIDSDESSEETEEHQQRPSKRQRASSRMFNPLSSHRHYCPHVCGFPIDSSHRDIPVWKRILTRLFQEDQVTMTRPSPSSSSEERNILGDVTTGNYSDEIDRIRKLLRLGIGSAKP